MTRAIKLQIVIPYIESLPKNNILKPDLREITLHSKNNKLLHNLAKINTPISAFKLYLH